MGTAFKLCPPYAPIPLKLLRLLLLPFIIVGRLLFWFLLAIAAWFLFRHLRKKAAAGSTPAAAPGEKAVESMVACERCGLLLPESESLRQGEAHFCCEEHLRGR